MPAEGGLDGRLRRIEEIVAALDSDEIDLDEALALFEEGVGHLRRARRILESAELKVEELIGPEGEEAREFGAPGHRPPGRGDRSDGDRNDGDRSDGDRNDGDRNGGDRD